MRRNLVLAAALGAFLAAPAFAGSKPMLPTVQIAELPNVEVKSRIIHTVPDDSATRPSPRIAPPE